MTTLGVLTATKTCDLDISELPKLLKRIIKLEAESNITFPRNTEKLCMAWNFVTSAGEWLGKAGKSKQAWAKYQDELHRQHALETLLVLGYVNLYADCHGCLWGVTVTEAGRSAEWPEVQDTGADTDACMIEWERGFTDGVGYAHKPAPAGFDNVVAAHLPASGWM